MKKADLIQKYQSLACSEDFGVLRVTYQMMADDARELEGDEGETELEKSQRLLKEELKVVERMVSEATAICKRCGMPTTEDGGSVERRGSRAVGGGIVCLECSTG